MEYCTKVSHAIEEESFLLTERPFIKNLDFTTFDMGGRARIPFRSPKPAKFHKLTKYVWAFSQPTLALAIFQLVNVVSQTTSFVKRPKIVNALIAFVLTILSKYG